MQSTTLVFGNLILYLYFFKFVNKNAHAFNALTLIKQYI